MCFRNFSAIACLALMISAPVCADDPLASWNDGTSKTSILQFVAKVTKEGSPEYVPPAERIAVFDNDGTLWCEQPIYVQLAFSIDRIRVLAASHPDWKEKQPFKGILQGNLIGALASGETAIGELIEATHTGMTTDEFHTTVLEWLKTARHPKFNRPYTELVYQPMLELLGFLRANGFKTYIVSGGGVEFMRAWAETVYGIPPEQIIGSSGKLKYEIRDGKPILIKLPELDHLDEGPGKPVGIQKFIGRRPLAAFGNSDGDFQMLEWTTAGAGTRLGLIVHHTDAEREWAYDRVSHIGKLDKGLNEASTHGWIVVDMKRDWKTIFRD
ncbi:HAD family hydrolase [Schlesneria paludicola]|uniref:HAD family hydrolase n=1 Tax=Schlesneria paludicola TaxID=360056 RepID=UPI00029A6ECD|nr:HAD family hydrolase [Schlesneria paludicola]